jgi:hypothetical protein
LRTPGVAIAAFSGEADATPGKTAAAATATFKKKIRHLEDKITLTPRCHQVIVIHKYEILNQRN